MDLQPLREKLADARRLADWIQGARKRAEEFPGPVVERVIRDYLSQFEALDGDLIDLAAAARTHRGALAQRAEELTAAARAVDERIDEFKLRHLIGELSEEAFTARRDEALASLDADALPQTESSIGEIDALLQELDEVTGQVGGIRAPAPAPPAVPEPADEEPADDFDAPVDDLAEASDRAAAEAIAVPVEVEARTAPSPTHDEADAGASADLMADFGAGLGDDAYGAPQEDWDVGAGASAEAAAPAGDDAIEEMMATGVLQQKEPDADEPEPPAALAPDAPAAAGSGPRLAVTAPEADEVVYPFTGDVLSLGRGRNNDIQIKNDGKISRYHCRIFRRGDEYIVEDNKSSNGTLVDGKLITRQRIYGGELVQLGETRVRFFLE